jgi:hypothetical protein
MGDNSAMSTFGFMPKAWGGKYKAGINVGI